MSSNDAQSKTGDSHPVTMAALADPANPSRVRTLMTIHHHGNDAPTVMMVAMILRNTCMNLLKVVLTLRVMTVLTGA